MVICIKVSIYLDFSMLMEFLFPCNKDGDIKENGQKVKYMAEEHVFGMMELYMMECGLIG